MMRSGERRLAKIEISLSPTQAVLLWLEEAHQHGSLQGYARWLKEQPEAAYPLVHLPRQVRNAVRDAARGQRRQDIDALILRAERDVTFLFKLFMEAHARVLDARKADALGTVWLLERLRRFSTATRQQLREEASTWRELALPLAAESFALTEMVETVERRYFGGHAVLFPDEADHLAQSNQCWNTVLALYADGLERLPAKQRAYVALRPETVCAAGKLLAAHDTQHAIAKAKAGTLQLMGDYAGAAALVDSFL